MGRRKSQSHSITQSEKLNKKVHLKANLNSQRHCHQDIKLSDILLVAPLGNIKPQYPVKFPIFISSATFFICNFRSGACNIVK